jgi:hypothetical protein
MKPLSPRMASALCALVAHGPLYRCRTGYGTAQIPRMVGFDAVDSLVVRRLARIAREQSSRAIYATLAPDWPRVTRAVEDALTLQLEQVRARLQAWQAELAERTVST